MSFTTVCIHENTGSTPRVFAGACCSGTNVSSNTASLKNYPAVVNKKVLNVLPAPLTVGSMQFLVGALYSSFLWTSGLRTPPKLSPAGKTSIRQIGFFHAAGQLFTMIALESAPVSFTHIVKALEPFFSALVSALLLGKWMKPQVYATLIPVVCGVGYACLKERYFSWLAFYTAMASNVAFALRAVCSKTAMSNAVGENITSANLFGLVTWAAFFISVPMFLGLEGTSFVQVWNKATETTAPLILIRQIVVSGLFHYLNNEVMYLALSNVHPVTLAVGNTMKRVFIMVASVMVFRNPISFQSGVGAAVGISGVLLYSLTKQHYEKLEAQQSLLQKQPLKKGKKPTNAPKGRK
jgi:solute carrier family 35 protein E1